MVDIGWVLIEYTIPFFAGDEIGGDKMNNSVKAGGDVSDVAISSNKNKSNIVNGIIITVIGGMILLLIKYYFHLI